MKSLDVNTWTNDELAAVLMLLVQQLGGSVALRLMPENEETGMGLFAEKISDDSILLRTEVYPGLE